MSESGPARPEACDPAEHDRGHVWHAAEVLEQFAEHVGLVGGEPGSQVHRLMIGSWRLEGNVPSSGSTLAGVLLPLLVHGRSEHLFHGQAGPAPGRGTRVSPAIRPDGMRYAIE